MENVSREINLDNNYCSDRSSSEDHRKGKTRYIMGYSLCADVCNCFSTDGREALPNNVIEFLNEQGFLLQRGTTDMKNNEPLNIFYYLDCEEPGTDVLAELNKIVKLLKDEFDINCQVHEKIALICGDV